MTEGKGKSMESLIEKLEAEMRPDSQGNEVTKAWRTAFTRAIAIVREHEAEQITWLGFDLASPSKTADEYHDRLFTEEDAAAIDRESVAQSQRLSSNNCPLHALGNGSTEKERNTAIWAANCPTCNPPSGDHHPSCNYFAMPADDCWHCDKLRQSELSAKERDVASSEFDTQAASETHGKMGDAGSTPALSTNASEVSGIPDEKLLVRLAGKAYMQSGKDKGCYSAKAMAAAISALRPYFRTTEPVPSHRTPDGRPIFGEDSPHDIGGYLEALVKEQPVEIRLLDESLAIRIVETLMRVTDRFRAAVNQTPVRDMAETLGEVESTIKAIEAATKRESITQEELKRTLMGHSMLHTKCGGSDSALPLVDMLTPGCDGNITRGIEEVDALAEALLENFDIRKRGRND
jgi:hypothetical protein